LVHSQEIQHDKEEVGMDVKEQDMIAPFAQVILNLPKDKALTEPENGSNSDNVEFVANVSEEKSSPRFSNNYNIGVKEEETKEFLEKYSVSDDEVEQVHLTHDSLNQGKSLGFLGTSFVIGSQNPSSFRNLFTSVPEEEPQMRKSYVSKDYSGLLLTPQNRNARIFKDLNNSFNK
jgi:hypothetical protein